MSVCVLGHEEVLEASRQEGEEEGQMDRGERNRQMGRADTQREILHSSTEMVMNAHCSIIYRAAIRFSIALSPFH